MIRQACRHRWGALPPSRPNRTVVCTLVERQRLPQAHVWSGDIVEGLEKDYPLPQTLAVFAETGCLTRQRGQGLAQGQVDAFHRGRADCEAQSRQAFGSQYDACAQCAQLALMLLFDQLSIDQLRMGLIERLTWAPPLARRRKWRHDVKGRNEGGQ